MAPEVGVSKPAIIRSVVVLPQPDGPSIEKNSPRDVIDLDDGAPCTLGGAVRLLRFGAADFGVRQGQASFAIARDEAPEGVSSPGAAPRRE
jgi:hypothetical protein